MTILYIKDQISSIISFRVYIGNVWTINHNFTQKVYYNSTHSVCHLQNRNKINLRTDFPLFVAFDSSLIDFMSNSIYLWFHMRRRLQIWIPSLFFAQPFRSKSLFFFVHDCSNSRSYSILVLRIEVVEKRVKSRSKIYLEKNKKNEGEESHGFATNCCGVFKEPRVVYMGTKLRISPITTERLSKVSW